MRRPSFPAAILLVAVMGSPARAVECFTPRSWQPRLTATPLDLDGNQVDDVLQGLDPTSSVAVLVLLDRCPGATDLARLGQFGAVAFRSRHLSLLGLTGVPVHSLAALATDPIVAFVEADRGVEAALDVSNPAIRVKPSPDYSPNAIVDKYPQFDGSGVNVAIIDSAVDDTLHESLLGSFVAGANCLADPCVVPNNPDDGYGHGTHVAGIALGSGGSSGTYQGIAPGAGLVDIRIMNPLGGSTNGALQRALELVLDKHLEWNASVINISSILPGCPPSNGTDAVSQVVNQLVQQGVLVVAAAGNSTTCGLGNGPASLVTPPGSADLSISVANSQDQGTVARSDDTISLKSLRGPRTSDGDPDSWDEQKPDVSAPGGAILSAEFNTASGYVEFSGTSMAAPHVAGCAALLRGAAPFLSALAIRSLLLDTAENQGAPGWDVESGHGLIDCFAALDQLVTYQSTALGFDISTCTRPPFDPPCWLSADVVPGDPNIVEGVPNTIHATVHNFGNQTATNFQVQLGVYDFSNSDQDYTVCTVPVAALPPFGLPAMVSCPFTPSVSGSGQVTANLVAKVIYPLDNSFDDNQVKHSILIQQAASPATFSVRVVNPTERDLTVQLRETFACPCPSGGPALCPCPGWTFGASENGFALPADACHKSVTLQLDPGAGAVPEATVHVAVLGTDGAGQSVDLSGFSLRAQLASTGEVQDSLRVLSKSGAEPSVALTLAWGPSCRPGATDYGIYEGHLGSWYSHALLDCTDDLSDRVEAVSASPGNRYYLVVPRRSADEGSYGRDALGVERPAGAPACVGTRILAACP